MSPRIIALCGPQGSGKTTLARLLVNQGYEPSRFAGALKTMIHTLLMYQGVLLEEAVQMTDGDLKETPTPFLDYKTPRHAMQTLGTEWRNLISKDLWVNIWERSLNRDSKIVVDDMRFLHEADRVHQLGGVVIKIHRPNNLNSDTHSSEQEYRKIFPDFIITNSSTPNKMLIDLNLFLESHQ